MARMSRLLATLLLVSLCLSPMPGWGQAIYGEIWGIVTDRTGEPIAGARVSVVSLQKGSRESTISNAKGDYVIGHLLPNDA